MLLHIYIRHLSPSVSDSQFTAYMQTNYNLFKQNVFSAHIRITESYLGKYLEPRKEPLQRFGTGKTFRHLS